MSKKIVCLGDPTNRGGKVISASSSFILHGRRAALVNDDVSCPEHGNNKIVEGIEGFSENGRLLVVHGCRCACGCVVHASGESGMAA
ncbi:PAAR domain-containing protein [Herbaspirillum sp. RV1423]|uniref:PAAR domain-containing protein n=1 Tax=Herbaspirillum sp. RV1423 TaxID=1443993 RepID=UPI0004B59D08|nr:PAAR domain-containing protein [Herbaspirillum sp. RV1423]